MRSLVVAEVNLKVILINSQQLSFNFLLRNLLVQNVLVFLEHEELVHDHVLLILLDCRLFDLFVFLILFWLLVEMHFSEPC